MWVNLNDLSDFFPGGKYLQVDVSNSKMNSTNAHLMPGKIISF
jgi:hypothetical protein